MFSEVAEIGVDSIENFFQFIEDPAAPPKLPGRTATGFSEIGLPGGITKGSMRDCGGGLLGSICMRD